MAERTITALFENEDDVLDVSVHLKALNARNIVADHISDDHNGLGMGVLPFFGANRLGTSASGGGNGFGGLVPGFLPFMGDDDKQHRNRMLTFTIDEEKVEDALRIIENERGKVKK